MPLFVSDVRVGRFLRERVPACMCVCAVHRRRFMEAMLRSRGASLILTQRQSLADGPSKILRA